MANTHLKLDDFELSYEKFIDREGKHSEHMTITFRRGLEKMQVAYQDYGNHQVKIEFKRDPEPAKIVDLSKVDTNGSG